MTYQYQIAIKTWQGIFYADICTVGFCCENHDPVKEFIECYGDTKDPVIFLEKLIAVFHPSSSHQDQLINWSSLSIEQIVQEGRKLLDIQQELEKRVSDLSRTRENQEIQKLRYEKVELKRNRDQLEKDVRNLQNELSIQRNQNSQYYQSNQELERAYNEGLYKQDNLVRSNEALKRQISVTHQIEKENEKLGKSKQNLEQRVQEIEQELRETQQRFSIATTRLRGINTHSELGGGDSRSNQLKNEFSQLKMGLFHDVSSKILTDWRVHDSNLTFRSEEFSKIKSILSRRVFGDGITYFTKDKARVDTELHLVMDALSSIKDFNPTPIIFQKIQEGVQTGLLQSKGIDYTDEAVQKYVEEVTQRINQDLRLVANLEPTSESCGEIKKFVELGLKIVRDIVNDSNSGEIFIPENDTEFDKNAHETRNDPQGNVKMTIYAGYRIKETVLVKADVITYEPESTLPSTYQGSIDSQSNNPENLDPKVEEIRNLSETSQQPTKNIQIDKEKSLDLEGEMQVLQNNENDSSKIKETGSSFKLMPEKSGDDLSLSISSLPECSELDYQNQDTNRIEQFSRTFKGKVTCKSALAFRHSPKRDAKVGILASCNMEIDFDAWIVGEPWQEKDHLDQQSDPRWYKHARLGYWLPAFYIKGEPPSDWPPMESVGDKNEVQ